MGEKLNKVEGEKANCPSCGDPIICVLKPASGNFAAKLVWKDRNPDGTARAEAHYGFDGTAPYCVNHPKKMEDPKNVRRPEARIPPSGQDLDVSKLPSGIPSEVTDADQLVRKVLSQAESTIKELYPNGSPQIGQIRSKYVEYLFSALFLGKK